MKTGNSLNSDNPSDKSYFKAEVLLKTDGYMLAAKTIMDNLLSGLHKSRMTGFNIEFSEYRQLNTGDDSKYIDWKLYAKTDKLFVKKYEEESVLSASILCDNSKSMGFCGGASAGGLSKLEYAKYIIACIIYKIIRQRDYIELRKFNDIVTPLISATNTAVILNSVDNILTELQPESTTDFIKSFGDYLITLKKKKLAVIISDLIIERGDLRNIIKPLTMLQSGGNNIIFIHILDNAELNLDFNINGPVEFLGLETADRILVDPSKIREKYKKIMNNNLRIIETELAAAGIGYIQINTCIPLEKNIMKIFRPQKK